MTVMTEWSGRVIPSTGQEYGLQEIAPGVFRYVYREGQETPIQAPSHDPHYQVNPGGTTE